MDIGASSWLVILLAVVAANLPFVVKRAPFVARLAGLAVLYFVVGGIAVFLEGRIGTAFPQTWEFYAIGACLFIVLAFPGFVIRYLYKPRR
jgi:hypothetical protein